MTGSRKIEVKGFEMLEKEAKLFKGNSSCTIYVPKEWEGKKILVVSLE
jgi:putative transposon-encoded protein